MCTKVHPTNSSGPLEPELSVGSEITPLSAMGGGRVDSFQFHSNILLWDHQWWHAEHTGLEIWLCSYGKDPHKCKEHSLVQNYCRDFEQSSLAAWLYLLLFSMPPTVATVNLPLNLYWLNISEQLCHCSSVYTITYTWSLPVKHADFPPHVHGAVGRYWTTLALPQPPLLLQEVHACMWAKHETS